MTDAIAHAVSEARLWERLMAMARIGTIDEVGVNRACCTGEDIAARRLLRSWAEALGLAVSVDAIGNLWLRYEGSDPAALPVLTGSHMDSQPRGGRFDGIYGVLAGLEAIEAMAKAGVRPRRAVELVAWTNEEGGRFAPGCMGSMCHAGVKVPADFAEVRDAEGTRFGDALRDLLEAERDLPRRPLGTKHHAYLESHIEQGPRLEAEGLEIGVVTGIQGVRWFNVTLSGDTAHAGAAPMAGRRDTVQAAMRGIAALNELMADSTDILRFTVGRIVVSPNTPNSVPNRTMFTIDFRHPDLATLRDRGDRILDTVRKVAHPCEVSVEETLTIEPVAFDPVVVKAVERAAAADGRSTLTMPSGAFHDAQFLVPVTPTGMLFIPCRKGISHNPAEYAEPGACANGARVLARALAELAA